MVVCFSAIREHNAAEHNATSLALLNMCVVGSGAVMQPLVGWVLDANWAGGMVDGARVYDAGAYTTAFMCILLSNVLALVCCFLLRETYCRPQWVDRHAAATDSL